MEPQWTAGHLPGHSRSLSRHIAYSGSCVHLVRQEQSPGSRLHRDGIHFAAVHVHAVDHCDLHGSPIVLPGRVQSETGSGEVRLEVDPVGCRAALDHRNCHLLPGTPRSEWRLVSISRENWLFFLEHRVRSYFLKLQSLFCKKYISIKLNICLMHPCQPRSVTILQQGPARSMGGPSVDESPIHGGARQNAGGARPSGPPPPPPARYGPDPCRP